MTASAETNAETRNAAAAKPRSHSHAEAIDKLLERLGTSASDGLGEEVAAEHLIEHGPNLLPVAARKPSWKRFLEQFRDPLVLTLLAAAIIAAVVGVSEKADASFLARFGDAIAIMLIVIMNAVIGYYQERRAEAALDALQKLAAPSARVRRGGKVMVIPAADVVPGDLLELEAGDAIAADTRLLQTVNLGAEESSLTGESSPVTKDVGAPVPIDAPLAERPTMVFTGTVIVRGKGRGVVTETGVHTELGRIGEMMRTIGEQKTPLEERLDKFGRLILWICIGLSAVLMLWGYVHTDRTWHELLLEAVSLAVAAIPEGLPAITTITLALGMQRMARRGAIVRKLPAVETLGAATVICADKTGTLTQNEMTVRRVYAAGKLYQVTGNGYDPAGEIYEEDGKTEVGLELPEPLNHLLATAALCNNAELERDLDTEQWTVRGDPTEGALLTLAEKSGLAPESFTDSNIFVAELPFDGDRKRMTIITRDERGREVAHVKGSIDALLPLCDNLECDSGIRALTVADRKEILDQADAMGHDALRVLALCRRETGNAEGAVQEAKKSGATAADQLERELTFLGLVGMLDPPRTSVKEAVATCSAAGIRAVMITGDHKLTATAIAREIELWEEGDEAITGTELANMSQDDLDKRIMHLRVFARTTAEQKLRIVRTFKKQGHVVAMTGDGVNDAPALREAHIGVAMGKAGTDVAREASALVLADDNFATIVDAIREGRAIYRNIQKFIFFLLSANMGLVVAVFTVSFVADWPPLTPLMILWINLVTNGLPALALGVDPPDRGLMEEPPRPVDEGLLVGQHYFGIAYVGTVMGAAAIILYMTSSQEMEALLRTRALAFSLLAISPLMHALSCRSPIRSLFMSRPAISIPLVVAMATSAAIHLVAILVPALRPVFRTFPVSATEWIWVLGLGAVVLPAMELAKIVYRRQMPRKRRLPASSSATSQRP